MKSRSKGLFAIALLAGLAFTSCDALFENQFVKYKLVTPPVAVTADELLTSSTADLLASAYTSTGLASADFYAALADDSTGATTTAVLATLSDSYTTSTVAATVQQAAILYTAVSLETSGAGAIVSNVASVFTSLDSTTPPTTQSVISAIIPASLLMDKAKFDTAVAAFAGLGTGALDVLGASLTSDPTAVDSSLVASAGEAALLATVINSLDFAQVIDPVTSAPYTSTADLIWALVSPDVAAADQPVLTSAAITLPATSSAGLQTADPNLYSLLNAAQLGGVVDLIFANLKPAAL